MMRAMMLALSALLAVTPAVAQQVCGPLAEVLHAMEGNQYHERPVFEGLVESGPSLLLYLNQATGSWTLLLVVPDKGKACPVMGGMKSHVLEALPVGSPL
jgi:hypothetical protein